MRQSRGHSPEQAVRRIAPHGRTSMEVAKAQGRDRDPEVGPGAVGHRCDCVTVPAVEHLGLGREPLLNPDLRKRAGRAIRRALTLCITEFGDRGRFALNRARGVPLDEAEGIGLAARLVHSIRSEFTTGMWVLIVALVFGGGWATLVPLAGAVIVPGTVIAQSNTKKVQHPTGGIVSAIRVHDGSPVREGDVLVELDPTQVRANLEVVSKQLDEARARLARLTAERDGRDVPPSFREAEPGQSGSNATQVRDSEASLFTARSDARRSQKELMRNRIGQLHEQIAGMEAQIRSKQTQSGLIAKELEGVQSLYEKHLTPLTRLTSLQRDAARLDGERDQLVSAIAETRAKISESELQLVKLDQDFRADVMKDLREIQDKEAELSDRIVAARDLADRIEIRSPARGVIHELSVHTVGGVVAPGEVMMVVIPDADELQIEGRLAANEIDQVRSGQSALVRFPAFNQRTTPELRGAISHVSADTSHDRQSTAGYYTVRASLPRDEIARLSGLQLVPGMPAEIFVQANSRTMMSYLLKPISDQFGRMFRER
jgi:HlyD family secretion protein